MRIHTNSIVTLLKIHQSRDTNVIPTTNIGYAQSFQSMYVLPYTPSIHILQLPVNTILPQALPYALPQIFLWRNHQTSPVLLPQTVSCTQSFSSVFNTVYSHSTLTIISTIVTRIPHPCALIPRMDTIPWKEGIKVINQRGRLLLNDLSHACSNRGKCKLDTDAFTLRHHLLFCKGIGTKTGSKLQWVIPEAGCYFLAQLTNKFHLSGQCEKHALTMATMEARMHKECRGVSGWRTDLGCRYQKASRQQKKKVSLKCSSIMRKMFGLYGIQLDQWLWCNDRHH